MSETGDKLIGIFRSIFRLLLRKSLISEANIFPLCSLASPMSKVPVAYLTFKKGGGF